MSNLEPQIDVQVKTQERFDALENLTTAGLALAIVTKRTSDSLVKQGEVLLEDATKAVEVLGAKHSSK